MSRTRVLEASGSYLDLSRAPCVLYGVKYIRLISLVLGTRQTRDSHIDASHLLYCYVLYGLNESTSRNLLYPPRPVAHTLAWVVHATATCCTVLGRLI